MKMPPRPPRPVFDTLIPRVLSGAKPEDDAKPDPAKIRAAHKKELMKLKKSKIIDLYLNIRYSEVMVKRILLPVYNKGGKFTHPRGANSKNGSIGGGISQRPPDPIKLSNAEEILRDNPPSRTQCSSSRTLADHLDNHSKGGSTFSKSWVNKYLKHHIKKLRPR